jgi:hypothetical protein
MGNAQSDSLDSVFSKINKQGGLPSSDTIRNEYASLILYVYQKPRESSDFLNDVQKRFFTTKCKFRWSWPDEKPQSAFSSLLAISRASNSAVVANESYKKIVVAISKEPQKYNDILTDLRLRFFDPSFDCPARVFNNDPSMYMNDFAPVFR